MARIPIDQWDALHIADWRADGDLRAGATFSLVWPSGARAHIAVVGRRSDALPELARVVVLTPDGTRHHSIQFAYVTLSFGTRPWFECPTCAARVGTLLRNGLMLGCRRCLPVTYPSQREQPLARHVRRLGRASERAGGDGVGLHPVPVRPKGMWNRTYQRHVSSFEEERLRVFQELCD